MFSRRSEFHLKKFEKFLYVLWIRYNIVSIFRVDEDRMLMRKDFRFLHIADEVTDFYVIWNSPNKKPLQFELTYNLLKVIIFFDGIY